MCSKPLRGGFSIDFRTTQKRVGICSINFVRLKNSIAYQIASMIRRLDRLINQSDMHFNLLLPLIQHLNDSMQLWYQTIIFKLKLKLFTWFSDMLLMYLESTHNNNHPVQKYEQNKYSFCLFHHSFYLLIASGDKALIAP